MHLPGDTSVVPGELVLEASLALLNQYAKKMVNYRLE